MSIGFLLTLSIVLSYSLSLSLSLSFTIPLAPALTLAYRRSICCSYSSTSLRVVYLKYIRVVKKNRLITKVLT